MRRIVEKCFCRVSTEHVDATGQQEQRRSI